VTITYDKKSRCFFARWRETQSDGRVKFRAVRLMRRSDRFHSKKDVRNSEQYKALVAQLHAGNEDPTRMKLLLAVAEARGRSKPDEQDVALVERVIGDDSATSVLLADFVESVYWAHAEASLRAKTVREYKSIWSRYEIASKVRGLRVCDFRTMHGADILQSIATTAKISKATLQRVKFLLSGIFVLAMNKGLCDSNPMTGVMLPQARGARETHAYTLDEILAMLRLPFDVATKAAIGLAAFAGLRESEIAGLQWSDDAGETISVMRSIDRVTGEPNPPKTAKSQAPVPVIPTLRTLLDALKATAALTPDGHPLPEAPMFPGIRQKYIDLDKLALRVIRPAIESAGIQWHGWHSYRRSTASNLYQLGADDLTVQRVLRHSRVNVTRERYIKIRDEKVESAMTNFENAIVKSNGNTQSVQ